MLSQLKIPTLIKVAQSAGLPGSGWSASAHGGGGASQRSHENLLRPRRLWY